MEPCRFNWKRVALPDAPLGLENMGSMCRDPQNRRLYPPSYVAIMEISLKAEIIHTLTHAEVVP